MINLTDNDAAELLRVALDQLAQRRAHEVIAGIDESRRLGVEESVDKRGEDDSAVPQAELRQVGKDRRRPPTDLEMLRIVFERIRQRLIVLPAIARTLQTRLNVSRIVWQVDTEFVSTDRVPLLEAKIEDLLPDGVADLAALYMKILNTVPAIVPPLEE